MNKNIRHFLRVSDLSYNEIQKLFERSTELKKQVKEKVFKQELQNRTLILLFEKHSTRTRLSFEIGMQQLGGSSIVLQMRDTQIDRGESIEDAARVISRMCDIIMLRTFEHSKIESFAKNSTAPIINGLTNEHHPCQVLSDIFTFREHRGSILGKTVSWIGDINNMCASWIEASNVFGFKLPKAIVGDIDGTDSNTIDRILGADDFVEGTDQNLINAISNNNDQRASDISVEEESIDFQNISLGGNNQGGGTTPTNVDRSNIPPKIAFNTGNDYSLFSTTQFGVA